MATVHHTSAETDDPRARTAAGDRALRAWRAVSASVALAAAVEQLEHARQQPRGAGLVGVHVRFLLSASFGVTTIACWEQYLRMPPAPWREPRPEALAPPIGSSSTV